MTALEIRVMNRIIELGIIPKCDTAKEFNEYMSALSPELRRDVKRKFRKCWRKLAKLDKNSNRLFPRKEKECGKPSVATKKVRRLIVYDDIVKNELAKAKAKK